MPGLKAHRQKWLPAHSTADRFGFLYVASSIMEYVPSASIRTAFFVLVTLWFTVDVIAKGKIYLRVDFEEVSLLVLLAIVTGSFFWGFFYGVSVNDWFRGVTPFIFLATYFTIDKSESDISGKLIGWMYVAAWVWALRILVELTAVTAFSGVLSGQRLTGVILDSVIPFGIVTVPFLISKFDGMRRVFPIILFCILIAITLLTGYRSQTSIIALQIVILILIWGTNIRKLIMFTASLGLSVIAASFLFDLASIFSTIVRRFEMTDANFESSRLAEWNFVLEQFQDSPLLGKGVGYQVPAEITFSGTDFSILNTFLVIPDSAGYVHSVTGYFMMTCGLFGVLSYFLMFLPALAPAALLRSWALKGNKRLALTAALSLISLLFYFQVQAAFRMIQMNLAIVMLLVILKDLTRRRHAS